MTIFDELAEEWDENPAKNDRAGHVAAFIRKRVPLNRGWRAMEFGCGTANLSFFLRSELGHITLVDNSAGMLEVARRKIAATGADNMTPMLADLLTEDMADGRFNLIYTMMVLHHLHAPERVLPVFRSLLHEGGYLCIAELEKGMVSFHGEDFEGRDGFTRGEMRSLVSEAGFEDIRIERCCGIHRGEEGSGEDFNVFLLCCRKFGN